jgi:hypothetical protein
VVAVDPSSPFSGGAILGDRIRMGEHQAHERVFIRSLASRGHGGGLSRTAARVIDLFDAAGYDQIIVETVGAGQSEVEVAEVADTRIVVCPPGLGDRCRRSRPALDARYPVVNKADLLRRTSATAGMLSLNCYGAWTPQGRARSPPAARACRSGDLIAACRGRRRQQPARRARAPPDCRERGGLQRRVENPAGAEFERLCAWCKAAADTPAPICALSSAARRTELELCGARLRRPSCGCWSRSPWAGVSTGP